MDRVSDQPPTTDIFVMDTDGSGVERLTTDGVYKGFLDWSPDGASLIYSTAVDQPYADRDIWELDLRTRAKRPLVTGPQADSDPSFSPTGDRLAFSRVVRDGNVGRSNVYLSDRMGLKQEQVGDDRISRGMAPSWSPDGQWLVVQDLVRHSATGLFLISTDGTTRKRLVYSGAWEAIPRWRPRAR
jgi:TolB protein